MARGILRCVLADYLPTLPQSLQFSYGLEGKPRLNNHQERSHPGSAALHEPGTASNGPEFNLAHANDIAVYAVAQDEIGIDVEYIDPDFDFAAVLETAATPREQNLFRALPPELRVREFFAWWTRKEAYVKALGQGFSIPPESFEVPVSPAKLDVIVTMNDGPWKLKTFIPVSGYVATVAARGASWSGRWQKH
jgi:4'-phosphopantetheinyl transferase